jgi:hypothetical protein
MMAGLCLPSERPLPLAGSRNYDGDPSNPGQQCQGMEQGSADEVIVAVKTRCR